MATHQIKKGLRLPLQGEPIQIIRGRAPVTRVAVMADDFPGMKPAMKVQEGETVQRGQVLFEDRKNPGVVHTSPGAGRVIGIHRGARRVLQSVVIDLSDGERAGNPDASEIRGFETYRDKPVADQTREEVVALLVESGSWTALRTRPFSKTPAIDSTPHSIFINAVDSNPLAPLPDVVLEGRHEDFARGVEVIAKLTEGRTYLCVAESSELPEALDALDADLSGVSLERWAGPHPSGTVGLHIHRLDPVGRHKTVWAVGYPDVAAIGALFTTGALDVRHVVSVAGPPVAEPRLLEARYGASTEDLAGDEGGDDEVRLIAGSVFSGKKAMGDAYGYLGRFDRQVSVLREGRERIMFGWLSPGLNLFSSLPIFLSRLFGSKRFALSTSTNGSARAMIPIGAYERVMPMDILPTFLLRSLAVGDVEQAEKLGCLELDEEDLALCTFVCPGKTNFGPILRKNLETIEKEG